MICQLTNSLNKEKIMSVYRTAMGKSVDMAALRTKNEKTRAVGNVKNLNARGDTIDAYGRVVVPATDKVNDAYGRTVGNRSSHVAQRQPRIQPDKLEPIIEIPQHELTQEERDLEESLEDDLEIEKIKQQELKPKKK
jgi:hypothetical protein